jgi:replicative DNA helicase
VSNGGNGAEAQLESRFLALPSVAGRVPPHDLGAEAAVLSAAMLDADALDEVLDILEPEHFYSTANELIFEAAKALAADWMPVDVTTVAGWLRSREQIQKIGGVRYLAQLVDATPAVAHVDAHARIVVEQWRLRELIRTCQKFAAEGYGDVGEPQTFIDSAEQAIYDIARTEARSTTVMVAEAMTTAFTALREAAERGGSITGMPTGFTDLDKKIAGLHRGDLLIIAARPGMGKTSLALNIAVNVAASKLGDDGKETPGTGVAVFTLEMPKEQLATRMLCSEARVDLGKLRQGYLNQDDWAHLTSAARFIGAMPMWIDDQPALSLLELRAKVRRAKAEASRKGQLLGLGDDTEVGLVVVDYLQLMRGRKDAKSREQEISEISRGLKALAKEQNVPVIALSQLNRGVETRGGKDKRPMLSDLRESGAIEQDADTVVFIFRPEYYDRETTDRGIAELIVSKQRNGPTGTVRTRFSAHCTRFDNLAPSEWSGYDDD